MRKLLNDKIEDELNEEIKAKIKILNGDKKEELTLKKKFDAIGLHSIDNNKYEGSISRMSRIRKFRFI